MKLTERVPQPNGKRTQLKLERYERLKLIWTATHPRATPAERQAALLRLAVECGV